MDARLVVVAAAVGEIEGREDGVAACLGMGGRGLGFLIGKITDDGS